MGPEFQLIETFVDAAAASPRAPRGPGDDAAVLPRRGGETCVTVDAVVEGVHFRRASSRLEDVGHKALAVNLSDLAAMGARPLWALVALGVPRGFRLADARRLGAGFGALARATGTEVVGGNVTRAPGLSLTVTVGGEVPPGRALLRSGARPGDRVWVSGVLGDARLGLALLEKRSGREAGHLAAASRVAVHLEAGALPVSRAFVTAHPNERERVRIAASGGEDYELLFTVPAAREARVRRLSRRLGLDLTPIGDVRRGRGVHLRGTGTAPLHGFDHLV